MGQHVNYEYINEFSREKYDRITILVPKGCKEIIQERAKNKGVTTSAYIVGFLPPELVRKFSK